MRFLLRTVFTLAAMLASLVSAALIPHADTPVFYLVGDDPFGDTFKVGGYLILSHLTRMMSELPSRSLFA